MFCQHRRNPIFADQMNARVGERKGGRGGVWVRWGKETKTKTKGK